MKAWFDKLNLEPQERRFLLAAGVLVFLVVNYWVVWPYFGEWNKASLEMARLNTKMAAFRTEIARKAGYESRLKALEGAGASGLLKEEEANKVQSTVYAEAALHNIGINRINPGRSSQTNAFFDEQVLGVDVTGGEPDLVGFLFALGSNDSRIRVRDISRLRLDPTQTRLNANITLVASFQRKPATPPPAARAAGGVNPAGRPAVVGRAPTNATIRTAPPTLRSAANPGRPGPVAPSARGLTNSPASLKPVRKSG